MIVKKPLLKPESIADAMVWPVAGMTLMGSDVEHWRYQCQIRYDDRKVPMIVMGIPEPGEKLCPNLAVYEMVMYLNEERRTTDIVHLCVECAYRCRAADLERSIELQRDAGEVAGTVAWMRSWRPASLFGAA